MAENDKTNGGNAGDDATRPSTGQGQAPYRNDPNVAETFADNCHLMSYDGAVLRMEFTVRRIDQAGSGGPRAYNQTIDRLVMPRQAIRDLHNQLSRIVDAMNKVPATEPKSPKEPEPPPRMPKGLLPN